MEEEAVGRLDENWWGPMGQRPPQEAAKASRIGWRLAILLGALAVAATACGSGASGGLASNQGTVSPTTAVPTTQPPTTTTAPGGTLVPLLNGFEIRVTGRLDFVTQLEAGQIAPPGQYYEEIHITITDATPDRPAQAPPLLFYSVGVSSTIGSPDSTDGFSFNCNDATGNPVTSPVAGGWCYTNEEIYYDATDLTPPVLNIGQSATLTAYLGWGVPSPEPPSDFQLVVQDVSVPLSGS